MGHNGHGINLYGVLMIPTGNLHAGGIVTGDSQTYHNGMSEHTRGVLYVYHNVQLKSHAFAVVPSLSS